MQSNVVRDQVTFSPNLSSSPMGHFGSAKPICIGQGYVRTTFLCVVTPSLLRLTLEQTGNALPHYFFLSLVQTKNVTLNLSHFVAV
jgi:hypothetical protein